MVTLLFACFAALYASKTAEVLNASRVTPTPTITPVLADGMAPHDLAWSLEQAVARTDEGGQVVVRKDARGVVVSLPEAGAFPTGQAELSQAARRVIREMAVVLAAEVGEVRVEGHTDDVPIATSKFASNWELSAARATEVIRFLVAQGDISPERLSAAGYGEFRPLSPNTSPDARARNRRVDIVILR
jgi:chemotaxis protein MotB